MHRGKLTYIAFGFAKSIKAVSCGLILMKVPFCKFMFLRMISEPSPTQRFSIIQTGMWHMPSSAENSSTPQYDFSPIYGLEIMKVIGYEMRSLDNSCNAEVGRITKKQSQIFHKEHDWVRPYFCFHGWSLACRWMQVSRLCSFSSRHCWGWQHPCPHCSQRYSALCHRDHRILGSPHRHQKSLKTKKQRIVIFG